MLIIKKQQLEQINDIKFRDFVLSCKKLIKDEHPEVFATRPSDDWEAFILSKIKMANNYGIYDSKNVYMYVLTIAKYPQYFHPRMPQWAIEMLTWPERNEDDKIVQICKEVYNRNQLS